MIWLRKVAPIPLRGKITTFSHLLDRCNLAPPSYRLLISIIFFLQIITGRSKYGTVTVLDNLGFTLQGNFPVVQGGLKGCMNKSQSLGLVCSHSPRSVHCEIPVLWGTFGLGRFIWGIPSCLYTPSFIYPKPCIMSGLIFMQIIYFIRTKCMTLDVQISWKHIQFYYSSQFTQNCEKILILLLEGSLPNGQII